MELQKIVPKYAHVMEGLNIVLIGAGGNGGYLVPNLARIISTLGVLQERIDFKVVDFDTVEEKNINRQLFVRQDIGLNKAEVLVKRYAKNFGLQPQTIGYIPGKLETPLQMANLMSNLWTNIVIDCVDNTTARSVLYAGFIEHTARRVSGANYLLSAGSGEWNGQVGIGGYRVHNGAMIHDAYIPVPYALHPEMIDPEYDKREATLGCAERAARNVQSINANLTASTILLNFMLPFFEALKAIPAMHGKFVTPKMFPITTGVVYFNTKDNSFNQVRLTEEYLTRKNPAVTCKIPFNVEDKRSVLDKAQEESAEVVQ